MLKWVHGSGVEPREEVGTRIATFMTDVARRLRDAAGPAPHGLHLFRQTFRQTDPQAQPLACFVNPFLVTLYRQTLLPRKATTAI